MHALSKVLVGLAFAVLAVAANAAPSYKLMLTGRSDLGAGLDVFIVTYDTFDDLINSPPAGGPGAFSGVNVSSNYMAAGLAFVPDPAQPPPGVPEPGTLALLILGLAGVGATRRRTQ